MRKRAITRVGFELFNIVVSFQTDLETDPQ